MIQPQKNFSTMIEFLSRLPREGGGGGRREVIKPFVTRRKKKRPTRSSSPRKGPVGILMVGLLTVVVFFQLLMDFPSSISEPEEREKERNI